MERTHSMAKGANDSVTDVKLDPTVDFVAGTAAGVAGLAVGHPFDTVKVRFQSPQIAKRYTSTFHALATIIREERVAGMYKGITSPLASCALLNGIIFASYRFFVKVQQVDDTHPTISQIGLAGVGSGVVSSIVTTPTELIKIRQQSLLTVTNAWAVARKIVQDNGVRGLYRGLTATALRDCGYGAYFAAYEVSCRCFSPTPSTNPISRETTPLSWPALLVAGGVAGVMGWVATFPLDVVKTRIQGSEWSPHPSSPPPSFSAHTTPSPPPKHLSSSISAGDLRINPYRTTLSTIVNSYRSEGLRVFYRGLAPTLIRAIPVNMVTFATFQTVVHGLS